jgi:large subunit ribosomal protein L3
MCEHPGKIFKGKKMSGHMGNISATSMNQLVVKIDTDRSLLYIKGQVAGPISGIVRVRDAVKKIDRQHWDLLNPTFIAGANA